MIGNNVADAPFGPSGTADIYGVMVDQASGTKIKSATGTVNITIKDIDDRRQGRLLPLAVRRGRPGLRRRDPRHVEPQLLRPPGQGLGRRVPLRHRRRWRRALELRRGEPHVRAAGGRQHVQRRRGAGDRPRQGCERFWRAQSAYLTPTSRLRRPGRPPSTAGCADLVGQDINAVSVEPSTVADGRPDHDRRLRRGRSLRPRRRSSTTEPTQCNFKPMLARTRRRCAARSSRPRRSGRRTSRGPRQVEARRQTSCSRAATATRGRPRPTCRAATASKVAFGPAPDEGDCSGGADDFSSANGITSPKVKLPGGGPQKLSASSTTWRPSPASTAAR